LSPQSAHSIAAINSATVQRGNLRQLVGHALDGNGFGFLVPQPLNFHGIFWGKPSSTTDRGLPSFLSVENRTCPGGLGEAAILAASVAAAAATSVLKSIPHATSRNFGSYSLGNVALMRTFASYLGIQTESSNIDSPLWQLYTLGLGLCLD
jgi:hypothetical protein